MKISASKLFLGACICLFSVGLSAQTQNPFLGTWDLDAAGSDFGATPVPKDMVRVYGETEDESFTYLLVTVNQDDSIGGSSAHYKYDGANNSIITIGAATPQATISYFYVNGRTVEYTVRVDGRTTQIGAKTLSLDSRVLTIVIQNIDSLGGSSSSQILRFNRRV